MDKKEAIAFLKQSLSEMPELAKLPYDNQEFKLWRHKVETVIKKALDSDDYDTFSSARPSLGHLRGMFPDSVYQDDYVKELESYNTALIAIIQKYELFGVEEKHSILPEAPPKAFIAHEGETQALTSLKKFLEALGIKYFIAESEASGGKSLEKHVNWVEEQGDFAIILATKGKAIDKKTGRYYMGLNVADELGSARQIYGNHIILLVQKGVQVHTNKKEIVYGEFTSTNMQEAFIKIARELKNWGFIRVGKVK
jgi:hypothetical protein